MTRTNPSLVISAHEQERIRLARELHDDVAQRVAFLSVELSELRFRLAALPVEFLERLARLSIETAEIGSELHRISHALHPARLERLGLEAALRSFCIDLAEAKQITVRQEVVGRVREFVLEEVKPDVRCDASVLRATKQ